MSVFSFIHVDVLTDADPHEDMMLHPHHKEKWKKSLNSRKEKKYEPSGPPFSLIYDLVSTIGREKILTPFLDFSSKIHRVYAEKCIQMTN